MRIHLVLEIICTLPHSRYLYNMLEAGRNPHTMKSEKQRDSNRLGTTYKDQGMQPAFFKQKQRRKRERYGGGIKQGKVLGFYQVKGKKNSSHNFLFWVPLSDLKF